MKTNILLKFAAIVGAVTTAVVALADDHQTYTYRLQTNVTGSIVPITRTLRGPHPFDQAWDSLSEAQKASLRDEYNDLGAEDEPPFPLRGLSVLYEHVFRVYDKKVDKRVAEYATPVEVLISVGPDGKVDAVQFLRGPQESSVRDLVGALIAEVPFKPGTRQGRPVRMDYLVEIDLGMCADQITHETATPRCRG